MAANWNPKIGDCLVAAHAEVDDDGKCSVTTAEWVVRTIQNRKTLDGIQRTAFLVQRNEFTWVKEKGKSQRYDWAPQIDTLWRKSHPIGGELPYGLFSTIRQALVGEIATIKATIKRHIGWGTMTPDETKDFEDRYNRLIAVVNGRITRLANQSKAKRQAKQEESHQ